MTRDYLFEPDLRESERQYEHEVASSSSSTSLVMNYCNVIYYNIVIQNA